MDIPYALLETIINKMALVYKMDMLYLKKFKLKIAK